MTDTEDMELLEREPPLASLAGFAAEARRGEGHLVLLGGALREAELADDRADTDDTWMYGAVAAWPRRTATPPPPKPPSSIFTPERASCHAVATALSPR